VDDRLAGRTALVFGGGHAGAGPHGVLGIGYACAFTFAAHGADVVIVDRDPQAAASSAESILAAGGSAVALTADMLDESAVDSAVGAALARFGHLDIVQNNVGATWMGGVADLSLSEWRDVVELNLDRVFLGARATLPHLVETRGSMINISSTASIRLTGFRYPAYAASKAAVNQLTQSMALQYATGVRIAGAIGRPLHVERIDDNDHARDPARRRNDRRAQRGRHGNADRPARRLRPRTTPQPHQYHPDQSRRLGLRCPTTLAMTPQTLRLAPASGPPARRLGPHRRGTLITAPTSRCVTLGSRCATSVGRAAARDCPKVTSRPGRSRVPADMGRGVGVGKCRGRAT
jgi:NAD(P)-dependent dehydrogenase (short-subunit alcohol dehydrogenase family)